MATEQELIENDILAFLDRNEKKELLRFVTVGSVDDGKSTLIGRLLHDTKGVYEDQLADATRTSDTGEQAIDFARITDGLRAEREQGITIDVAYRYFSTPTRKFIIADTPGHTQYTRNMATGASTANVALILIDARLGVLPQSRRHATIASLLGIPHLLVCVNKLDLVDYDEGVHDSIVDEFRAFTDTLAFTSVQFVPVSALMGVNVVDRSQRTPWYDGPTVLEYLETVEISKDRNFDDLRFPVQYVIRPNLDYRGYAGEVASGVVRKGDAVTVLPSGIDAFVTHIDTYDGELDEAFSPMGVVLRLDREIDISRGDMLVHTSNQPNVGRSVEAMVVWMSETPLDPAKSYLIKHTTRYVRVAIDEVAWKYDLEELTHVSDIDGLALNDIGLVRLTTHQPIAWDPYRKNRATGAFIIIDTLTNTTVGAGMLQAPSTDDDGDHDQEHTQITPAERIARLGHDGAVLCVFGSDPHAVRRVGYGLEKALFDQGKLAYAMRGDAEAAFHLASAGVVVVWVQGQPTQADRTGAATFLRVDVDGRDESGVIAEALSQL